MSFSCSRRSIPPIFGFSFTRLVATLGRPTKSSGFWPTTALEWSYLEAQKDVSPKHLEAAAEQLTLRRDVIYVIDAIGQKEENKGQSEGKTSDAKEPNPK